MNEYKDKLTNQVSEYFEEEEIIIQTVVDLLDKASSYWGVVSDVLSSNTDDKERRGDKLSKFCCVPSYKLYFEKPIFLKKLKLLCYCPYETEEECSRLYKRHKDVCDNTKNIIVIK